MSLTNEQIDAVIDALQWMKSKREPRVLWEVLDRHDESIGRASEDENDARAARERAGRHGSYPPYTIYRCVEVIE